MDKIQNSTAYGVLNDKYAYGTPEGMNIVIGSITARIYQRQQLLKRLVLQTREMIEQMVGEFENEFNGGYEIPSESKLDNMFFVNFLMNRVTKETIEYFGRKWLISFFNGEICLHRQFNSWEFPNSVDTRKVL